jgi:hypothetical protein
MRFRRPPVMASERLAVPAHRAVPACRPAASARRAVPAVFLLTFVVGCSSPSPAGTSSPAACGMTRTAANVPVTIQVEHGQVSCATALAVERDYAKVVSEGQAPGNGGGGPVHVHGWTCQGFPTPVVLKTGRASKCVQDGEEILAILPSPA